jgi:hypothetical protein
MSKQFNIYAVKVRFEVELDKYTTRQFVVDAVSPTEAEVRTTEYLKDSAEPFEVISCTQTRYEHFISQ